MSSTQQSLDAFHGSDSNLQDAEQTEGRQGEEQEQTECEPETEDDAPECEEDVEEELPTSAEFELPDRDHAWQSQENNHTDGPLFTPQGPEFLKTNGPSLRSNQIGYLPEGRGEVGRELTTEQLAIPKYYSRMDEFGCHVSAVDTSGSRRGCWGLRSSTLEGAMRYVSGGGRYASDDFTLHATAKAIYFLEYQDETWVLSGESMKIPQDYEHECVEVAGFTVPEDSEAVHQGIEPFVQFVTEWFNEDVVGFDDLTSDGSYIFKRTDGSVFKVDGRVLCTFGTTPLDPENALDTYEVTTDFGETFTVTWDELHYEIGDSPYNQERSTDAIFGFQMRWEDPRQSRRVSMSGKIIARAKYYYLLKRTSDRTPDRYEVRDTAKTLKRVEPTEKQYDPIDSCI